MAYDFNRETSTLTTSPNKTEGQIKTMFGTRLYKHQFNPGEGYVITTSSKPFTIRKSSITNQYGFIQDDLREQVVVFAFNTPKIAPCTNGPFENIGTSEYKLTNDTDYTAETRDIVTVVE